MKPFWNKYNFPNILEWIKSKTVHLKQNLIISAQVEITKIKFSSKKLDDSFKNVKP